MAKISEKYEVLYVINPNLSEEETQGLVEKFKTLIEQNGTIDAVEELERKGFRAAIRDAMKACADKSRAMSK